MPTNDLAFLIIFIILAFMTAFSGAINIVNYTVTRKKSCLIYGLISLSCTFINVVQAFNVIQHAMR